MCDRREQALRRCVSFRPVVAVSCGVCKSARCKWRASVLEQNRLLSTGSFLTISRFSPTGVMLGPVRFNHIRACASQALSRLLSAQNLSNLLSRLSSLDAEIASHSSSPTKPASKDQYAGLDEAKAERLVKAREKRLELLVKKRRQEEEELWREVERQEAEENSEPVVRERPVAVEEREEARDGPGGANEEEEAVARAVGDDATIEGGGFLPEDGASVEGGGFLPEDAEAEEAAKDQVAAGASSPQKE